MIQVFRRKCNGKFDKKKRDLSLEQVAFSFRSRLVAYLKTRYTLAMHIITRKALIQFWDKHPDSQTALQRWFKIVQKTDFQNFAELRAAFPSADKVDQWIVFNIGGNKYRLIASIHFNRNKLYIRHVLTHAEYDRGDWKNDPRN